MTRTARRRGDQALGERGIALVETLASLVVVSMMALMIVEGVGTGRRVWERIDAREASAEVIDSAQQTLRDRLRLTYPRTLYDADPPSVDFQGDRDTVVFIANPPAAGQPAPLRRYSLGLDTAGELVLASVSDVDPKLASTAGRQVLVTGVRALDIAYFGPGAPDRARRWRSAWRDQPLPPELVRIRVEFEPGDRRAWPDLIVHPRATIDTACSISISTHLCRGRAA
jgi:general secretion pathway protein J